MANNFLSQISEAGNIERPLRAYAYLQASFQTNARNKKRIDDVFDCLLPFIIRGISEQDSNQLDIDQLQAYLKNTFDFTIPVFVINHLLPRTQELGAIEWNKVLRVYICRDENNLPSSAIADPEIISTDDFSGVETAIKDFSTPLQFANPISSNTWSEALIRFLKSASELTSEPSQEIKGIIIANPEEIDNFIVARFIQRIQEDNPTIFSIIVKIYTGILIEDFVRSVQEISVKDEYPRLTVYYDTSIILRLLGSSGEAYQKANLEMHHAIENLGCKTEYFEHTEIEVENILETILSNYDLGKELFGETAEAMLRGEVKIEEIKDLSATFSERIARLNIFKSRFAYENTTTANYYQINENEFEQFLSSEAEKTQRRYSQQNVVNDTKTLAITMRLRHGVRSRDVAKCKHVFVSSNKLLARSARSFIAENEKFGWRNAPPLLTVGQMSTLAWLAGSQKLEAGKISTELLANCYGAVQPDPEWTPQFLKALGEYKDSSGDISIAESAVFLNAARRIAQDQSFAKTAIFQKLNTLEIFDRAAKEFSEQQEHAIKEAIELEEVALEIGVNRGRAAETQEQQGKVRKRAENWASKVIRIAQYVIVIVAVASFLLSEGVFGSRSFVVVSGQIIVFLLAILQIADLIGVPMVRPLLDKCRVRLADRFGSFLTGV